MAFFLIQSGVADYSPSRPNLFREETRKWFIRFDRASVGAPLTVKVYDTLAKANAGVGDWSASGQVSLPITANDHTVSLTSVGAGSPPTFTNATINVNMLTLASTGTSVWRCDLGTKLQRAVLMVQRAISDKVRTANGYFFTLALVELGIKQWEEVEPGEFPYVGIYGGLISSEPGEIGAGGSWRTELQVGGVAHMANVSEQPADGNALLLYHDIRRAVMSTWNEAYTGGVYDGPVADEVSVSSAEPDKMIVWARDRASLNFIVTCSVHETGEEVEAG